MTLTLTLTGETLGEIIDQMRFLFDTVKTDEGTALLAAMHQDLPCAVRRAPRDKAKGAPPTREELAAAFNAQAPACSKQDVLDTIDRFIKQRGAVTARAVIPGLIGADRVSALAPEDYWRAKAAVEAAIAAPLDAFS